MIIQRLSFIACSLLLATALCFTSALAQGSDRETAVSSGPVHVGSGGATTELIDGEGQLVTCEPANFALWLPPGGTFLTEAEAGMSEIYDLMVYPVIWTSDGAADFNVLTLSYYDTGSMIDEQYFWDVLDEHHTTLLHDFPMLIEESVDIELGGNTWNRIVLGSEAMGAQFCIYTIYSGSLFYSMAFGNPLGSDVASYTPAIESVVSSFSVLELPGEYEDGYYDEEDEEYYPFI